MKKLFILPAALLFAGIAVSAQGNSFSVAKASMDIKDARKEKKEAKKELRKLDDDPGVMVKDHFYADFGDLHPTWKKTRYFDEATFVQDGRELTAYYDVDAELVGTTSLSDFNALPASAQRSILKEYKGYNIDHVILFDDNEANTAQMVLYGSTISDEDNYFVELTKGKKMVVLEVNMEGLVSFFTEKTK